MCQLSQLSWFKPRQAARIGSAAERAATMAKRRKRRAPRTGRGCARADALVARLLDALRTPAHFSTTDEELAIVGPACEARGLKLEPAERGRLSEVVGDVVRTCRLR